MGVEGVRRSDLKTAGLGGLMDPGAEGVVGDGEVATGLKQVSERMKG